MKADKREIVTFVIAALATLVAVWFFLGKMQKEKDTVRTDLYTLVAPASDAILSVNRPAGYLPFHHPKQPEYPVVTSIFPSTGSYPLCTSGKQPRRPDREKHIAKGFRLVRSAETKKGRHHFYLLPGYRKPFFRLLSTRGHMGGKLQQETTRRSRPNPTKPAKLPATRPRPPAQVIRQKRPFEPDGTIGQSRPLCFPPRFNRMGYPKRLVRRRSFHE